MFSALLSVDALLAPPPRDSPASRSYCPRCQDQFVKGSGLCPHGVALCRLSGAVLPQPARSQEERET